MAKRKSLVSKLNLLSILLILLAASSVACFVVYEQTRNLALAERRLNLALDASQLALWDVDVASGAAYLSECWSAMLGGEAQRVKLALELSKRDTGQTLYILDEPTTGLHFQDIALLLAVLHRLRDHGNTVVVIEHNLDVIKTADWIVDLRPEGGDGGGHIVAQGTPETVAGSPGKFTGQYLQRVLGAPGRPARAAAA